MLCYRYLGLRPQDCDELDYQWFQDLITVLQLVAYKERNG